MALFEKLPLPVEDHGHGLQNEYEEVVSDLSERVGRRTDTVRSRLAALEDEHGVLQGLSRRLSGHKAV